MPAFAASLATLWTELPLMDRLAAAARAGFEWVEIPFPYDLDAAALRRELVGRGLRLALMACPPPNYAGGPRGFAAVPGAEERFRKDFLRSLRYAELLRPRVLQILPGAAEGADAHATLVANLAWAAERAGGQRMTIEPVDPGPAGAFLRGLGQAAAILDEVGAPNLALQFDAAHVHTITGDVVAAWAEHGERAGHVQIADMPGRTPPGRGTIDLAGLLAAIDAGSYEGPVGAEYRPDAPTDRTLRWLEPPAADAAGPPRRRRRPKVAAGARGSDA